MLTVDNLKSKLDKILERCWLWDLSEGEKAGLDLPAELIEQ